MLYPQISTRKHGRAPKYRGDHDGTITTRPTKPTLKRDPRNLAHSYQCYCTAVTITAKMDINPFRNAEAATNVSQTMSKTETTSKVSLKLLSRINPGRRGARAEVCTLDTAHKFPHPPPRTHPRTHAHIQSLKSSNEEHYGKNWIN